MTSERNYGVIDHDPEDVADLEAVFAADWSEDAADYPDLDCTRLLVAPVNARSRLLELVNSAASTLDFSVMYLSDDQVVNAVRQRAAAGVAVRVLLADPAWIGDNADTAVELAAAGIPVRFLERYELHAKLVIGDGVAFVGSENFSWTSLDRNREVGVLVTEPGPAGAAAAQFAADWAAGVERE
jgi:phosphatidylserine/phosphatidylglycerophosphate/cardiolipin synthase-like enzyme